jgi:DNA-binding MarR family transcriptional regulator
MRKTYNQLERIIKGFANHRRIEILELLKKQPELSVAEISDRLKINFKNASGHIQKMAVAGLIIKRYDANNVRHKLTLRGKTILEFCRILE